MAGLRGTTGARVAIFGKARKRSELADQLRSELVPREDLQLDPADDAYAAALDAARAGDPAPVAAYLAELRGQRAWEQRSRAVDRITTIAVDAPLWVKRWAEGAPDDPDAQLTYAALLIRLAWATRTTNAVQHVEGWRFGEFHEQLEGATPQIQRAVDLNPGDPEPWRLAMQQATGLEAPEEVFREHLARARECDPVHYQSLEKGVNRLSAKWGGSHEKAFDLAEEAAGAAGGRAVQVLPLRAGFEMWIEDEAAKKPLRPRVERALATAQAYADRFPDGAVEAAEARSLLGYMYAMLDRWQESYDAFRATGPVVSDMPWEYNVPAGKDNLDRFATFRDAVVVRLADASA